MPLTNQNFLSELRKQNNNIVFKPRRNPLTLEKAKELFDKFSTTKALTFNREDAIKHLSLLRFKSVSSDHLLRTEVEKFWFQLIVEGEHLNRRIPRCLQFHTSFIEIEQTLLSAQQNNYGVFVAVNDFESSTKNFNCTNINSLFIDYDKGKILKSDLAEPNFIVETNKGLHQYWLTPNLLLKTDEFSLVSKELTDYYDADNKCININRVLRLSGFNHLKQSPFLIKLQVNHERQIRPSTLFDTYSLNKSVEQLQEDYGWLSKRYKFKTCLTNGKESELREYIRSVIVKQESGLNYLRRERDENKTLTRQDFTLLPIAILRALKQKNIGTLSTLRTYLILRSYFEVNKSGKVDLREVNDVLSLSEHILQDTFGFKSKQTFKTHVKFIKKHFCYQTYSEDKSETLYFKSLHKVLTDLGFEDSEVFDRLQNVNIPINCLSTQIEFKKTTYNLIQRLLNGRNFEKCVEKAKNNQDCKLFSRKTRAKHSGISTTTSKKYEKLAKTKNCLLRRFYRPFKGKSHKRSFKEVRNYVDRNFKDAYRIICQRDKHFNWYLEEKLGTVFTPIHPFSKVSSKHLAKIKYSHKKNEIAQVTQYFQGIKSLEVLILKTPSIFADLGVSIFNQVLQNLISLIKSFNSTSKIRFEDSYTASISSLYINPIFTTKIASKPARLSS